MGGDPLFAERPLGASALPHICGVKSQSLDFGEVFVQGCSDTLCFSLSQGLLWDTPHPTTSPGATGTLHHPDSWRRFVSA